MKLKFFKIPAAMPDMAADELNAFCSQHRVVQIDKQFVSDREQSYWSICVTWLDGQVKAESVNAVVDYKAAVGRQHPERFLFRALRRM